MNTEIRLNTEEEYKEILELHKYCKKIGVHTELRRLYDGYHILFKNGGDVIQHRYSYGSACGYVEPTFGSDWDYSAVSLQKAKELIRRHKDKLNKDWKEELKND